MRSIRLVLEGKPSKEISELSRLTMLGNFLQTSFPEINTSGPLNRGSLFTLIYLCWEHYSYFSKDTGPKCMGTDGIFCFISISKFGSFENPFAKINSLSKLHFNADDYFVGTNKRPKRPKPTPNIHQQQKLQHRA